MKTPQIRLGQFVRMDDDSLHGKIGALGLGSIDVVTVEAKTKGNDDKYLKFIGDPDGAAFEMGAAFPMQKGNLSYFFVRLDSPLLEKPILAALFKDNNSLDLYNLVWNRQDAEPKPAVADEPKPEAKSESELPARKRKFVGAGAAPTI